MGRSLWGAVLACCGLAGEALGQPEERAGEPSKEPGPAPAAEEPARPSAEPVAPPQPALPSPAQPAAQEPPPRAVEPPSAGEKPAAAADKKRRTSAPTGFFFGSYGRVVAASDGRGRPGRDADIVAHGSRLDHSNYVELELRRDDYWEPADASTRFVSTLAIGNPIFHYAGDFDTSLAVRNLYLEERDLGAQGLSLWVGSRLLRGDDIYLFDFWPLDNLNTMGGGLRFDQPVAPPQGQQFQRFVTGLSVHMGLAQPGNPFYRQEAARPAPLNQFGAATVAVLDRQRWVGSLRGEEHFKLSPVAGIKAVLYGEAHHVPSAQRESQVAGVFEELPVERGFAVGAEVGGYSGERDTHLNLFVRYARGLAAYGEFASPSGLGLDRSTADAHELVLALSGNGELGPVAVMAAAYFRSFRNASSELDFEDIDEGIVMARPQLFLGDWAGVAVEGSYQLQERGVLLARDSERAELEPQLAGITRVGVMPFVCPRGPGSFSRPMFYLAYVASFRDAGARALYPKDDPFSLHEVEHFMGMGAEWWFGSTSYGGP
ncbi:MAG: carbohydrate porin [Deltaproteobacteria bacterium]|nr:carbohydrate porin [Deltaproteobacteria bacterium]